MYACIHVDRIDRRDGRKKRSESERRIAIAFTYAYPGLYILRILVNSRDDPNSRRTVGVGLFFSFLSKYRAEGKRRPRFNRRPLRRSPHYIRYIRDNRQLPAFWRSRGVFVSLVGSGQ